VLFSESPKAIIISRIKSTWKEISQHLTPDFSLMFRELVARRDLTARRGRRNILGSRTKIAIVEKTGRTADRDGGQKRSDENLDNRRPRRGAAVSSPGYFRGKLLFPFEPHSCPCARRTVAIRFRELLFVDREPRVKLSFLTRLHYDSMILNDRVTLSFSAILSKKLY